MTLFAAAAGTLFRREIVRFVRQKNRIVGALGTPLVFWIFIGSGLKNAIPGAALLPGAMGEPVNYLQFFFPGTMVLILLFTAIFSTISIIEDRQQGFLQGVLVSPAPRSAIVFGKLLGGAALATTQGVIFMLLSPFLGIRFGLVEGVLILLILFLMSFALTGLGFIFAWILDSSQGFHAIMNLCLMPLWLLSGSMFPVSAAPAWLSYVMAANPLTYSVAALHLGFFGVPTAAEWPLCFAVTAGFAVLMFAGALFVALKKGVSS